MATERALQRKHRSRPLSRSRWSALRAGLGVSACVCAAVLVWMLAGAGARAARGQDASPQANSQGQDQQKQNPQKQDPEKSNQAGQNAPASEPVAGDPDATMVVDPDAPPSAAARGGNAGAPANSSSTPASANGGAGRPMQGASAGAASSNTTSSAAPAGNPGPSRPLTAEERRKQQVADECADLLKMATELKTDVDKTTKDELSIAVVRKAGQLEQYAHKLRTDPSQPPAQAAADKPQVNSQGDTQNNTQNNAQARQ